MPGMVQFKEIKPARLQDKKMVASLNKALQQASKDMLFDFEATTYTFTHKVKWQRLVSVGPNSVDILVGTDDEIYTYLHEGTKRHFIKPVNAKALRWQDGGSPKTVVGKLIASPGSPATGAVHFDSHGHYVKGIKARKFSVGIKKIWDKKFKTQMEKAMKEAAQDSGHGFFTAVNWK